MKVLEELSCMKLLSWRAAVLNWNLLRKKVSIVSELSYMQISLLQQQTRLSHSAFF
jgi:hypothetical protein